MRIATFPCLETVKFAKKSGITWGAPVTVKLPLLFV